MANYRYNLISNSEGTSSLTVKFDNEAAQVITESHPNFTVLRDKVLAGEGFIDPALMDVAKSVEVQFAKVTDRVTVRKNKVFYGQDEVNGSITSAILRGLSEQGDATPLALFLENLAANPEQQSRENLYEWLEQDDFTITDDGCFIGYKGVREDGDGIGYSTSRGHAFVNGVEYLNNNIPNKIGDVVEMPRAEVTFDPARSCAAGLHVGTHRYAGSFGNSLMRVKVNPRDVVSVPNGEGEKMRVCRYEVMEFSPHKVQTQVYTDTVDEFSEDDEEFVCDHCGGPTDDESYLCDNCYLGDEDDYPSAPEADNLVKFDTISKATNRKAWWKF
jgi:hypothetical protein